MNLLYKIVAIALIVCTVVYAFYFININQQDSYDSTTELLQALRQEVTQEIKTFKMRKLIQRRDLVLRKDNFSQISDYQKYVTPDNLVLNNYISTNSIYTSQQAYNTAVSWIWVSDETLHKKSEHWLLPQQFIQDTPNDPDNPSPGDMVSDCESQAYTLVSILEAIGISKANVRVVVGEVDFQGEIGGHAWVQIYLNNEWMELEATSGPFYDDEEQELVQNSGFSYSYFKNHPYPVEEYWAFFNDRYYYNPHNNRKSPDLPTYWLI
jgi:hypothetical protein